MTQRCGGRPLTEEQIHEAVVHSLWLEGRKEAAGLSRERAAVFCIGPACTRDTGHVYGHCGGCPCQHTDHRQHVARHRFECVRPKCVGCGTRHTFGPSLQQSVQGSHTMPSRRRPQLEVFGNPIVCWAQHAHSATRASQLTVFMCIAVGRPSDHIESPFAMKAASSRPPLPAPSPDVVLHQRAIARIWRMPLDARNSWGCMTRRGPT